MKISDEVETLGEIAFYRKIINFVSFQYPFPKYLHLDCQLLLEYPAKLWKHMSILINICKNWPENENRIEFSLKFQLI